MGPVKGFDFTEESIRKGFIRKVYSILSVSQYFVYFYIKAYYLIIIYLIFTLQCQLLITLGFIFLFGYEHNTRKWVYEHPGMFYTSMGVMFVTMIVMACCENVRRKSPMNFIFLVIFTLAESYIVAMGTFRFNQADVSIDV